jgi:uncharacterized protein with HEPN domain
MLDAAQTARDLIVESSRESFLSDRRTQLAVWKLLEIIGEAARHVSKAFKDSHPDVPWSGMVGLRNVLAHDYRRVRLDRMWRVVRDDTPKLVEQLAHLVPPPPQEEPPGE